MENYAELAMRTANKKKFPKEKLLLNAMMGLAGESGELLDTMKKHLFQEHPFDREKFIDELGDIRWYMELALYSLDATMDEIETKNIEKLAKRYPKGEFERERSINRESK